MNPHFSHEPDGYSCPFCLLIEGKNDEYSSQDDIVYQNEHTTAKISPKWWINNLGNVIVVPNQHYENIYDIPDEVLGEVYKTVKKLAIAIRNTYGCDGTSTRQHNEPAGNQSLWHFHVHVFARYSGDNLYQNHDTNRFADQAERTVYAKKLRGYLSSM